MRPQSIDALADALEEFEGGVVIISHDARLLSRVCDNSEMAEVWIVEDGEVHPWDGTFEDYKGERSDSSRRRGRAGGGFARPGARGRAERRPPSLLCSRLLAPSLPLPADDLIKEIAGELDEEEAEEERRQQERQQLKQQKGKKT